MTDVTQLALNVPAPASLRSGYFPDRVSARENSPSARFLCVNPRARAGSCLPRRSLAAAALAARGWTRQFSPMELGNLLVLVAIVAVGLVLLLGLLNMMRGGSPNRSQQLMRWRVLLQFAAVVVIMGVVWWRAA